MMQTSANILPELYLLPALSKNVVYVLILTLTCTLLAWYVQYHWKRRKLYQVAAQMNGPLSLPLIGNALYFRGSTADILGSLLRLSEDYESPVRLWMGQKLFFAVWTANDLKTLMNSPHALKKPYLYRFGTPVVGHGLVSAPVPQWKRHRKIINPTFNQKILDEFVEIFSEQSQVFVEQLTIQAGKGIFDIMNRTSRYSLDILCETLMGISVNAQTTESNYYQLINRSAEIVYIRSCNYFYHPDFIFNRTSMAKELHDGGKAIHEFTSDVLKKRRAAYQEKQKQNRESTDALCEEEPRKREPFLQQLIELSEKGIKFTDEEIIDELKTFMVGGTDTSASTESFVMIMLGMFPEIQRTVYEEVIDALGPEGPVKSIDLSKLEYLERVIKETMRLFPGPVTLVRDITGDITLESCTIPANSTIMMIIIATHRDPNLWPDPLKFDPDRFLPEEVAKRHPYSYLPFSGGPRNCIGFKYAMMAMKVLIAMVIRKYRIFTDYKSAEGIKLKAGIWLKPVDGYNVSVELRE